MNWLTIGGSFFPKRRGFRFAPSGAQHRSRFKRDPLAPLARVLQTCTAASSVENKMGPRAQVRALNNPRFTFPGASPALAS